WSTAVRSASARVPLRLAMASSLSGPSQPGWSNGSVTDAPIHIRPTAELAPRALLPGDPGRALMLAQLLLDEPRMFNHHRGLWGYTVAAADGQPLTIQSTG